MSAGAASGDSATKQVLRLSLTRLIGLSSELARDGRAARIGGAESDSALVTIRRARGGVRPPLFLMHPVGGSVMSYHLLARSLHPDQPVYAVENQIALNPRARLHRTIEEMAAAYLELIATVQPGGPYFLGGYSMGGLIAFELARQAAARGCAVPLLAIIDTPARVAREPEDENAGLSAREVLTMATIIGRRTDTPLKLRAAELERLDHDARIARLIDALQQQGVLPPEADRELFYDVVAAIRGNDRAQRRYRPQPYEGDVELVRATRPSTAVTDETGSLYADPAFGWQDVCTRPVTVSHVPGTHLRLMDKPCVGGVGAWLQRRIDDRAGIAAPA